MWNLIKIEVKKLQIKFSILFFLKFSTVQRRNYNFIQLSRYFISSNKNPTQILDNHFLLKKILLKNKKKLSNLFNKINLNLFPLNFFFLNTFPYFIKKKKKKCYAIKIQCICSKNCTFL